MTSSCTDGLDRSRERTSPESGGAAQEAHAAPLDRDPDLRRGDHALHERGAVLVGDRTGRDAAVAVVLHRNSAGQGREISRGLGPALVDEQPPEKGGDDRRKGEHGG